MDGEKAHANSEGVRRRGGHLLSDNHSLVEGTTATGRRAEVAGRDADGGRQNQSLADSRIAGCKGSEARPEAETRLEERPEAQTGNCSAIEERGQQIDPLALPYVALSELRYLPTHAGIYFAIEEGGKVAYIGQSLNIRQRWRSHHVQDDLCDLSSLESARRVRLAWLEVSDVEILSDLERAMIQRFRPRLNGTHTRSARTVAMKKKEHEFMTAREFARAIKRPYPTVALWLRKGLVPGVKEIELGTAKLWQIPVEAAETFVPPKPGRPLKKVDTNGESQASAEGAGNQGEASDGDQGPATPKRKASKNAAKKPAARLIKKKGSSK